MYVCIYKVDDRRISSIPHHLHSILSLDLVSFTFAISLQYLPDQASSQLQSFYSVNLPTISYTYLTQPHLNSRCNSLLLSSLWSLMRQLSTPMVTFETLPES